MIFASYVQNRLTTEQHRVRSFDNGDRFEMRVMSEILEVVGAQSHDIENWLRTLDLRTSYEKTVPGRARSFSRENTLELAFIAAFTRQGVRASTAAARADALVRGARNNSLREWVIFAGGSDKSFAMDKLTVGKIQDAAKQNGGVSIIAARFILDRVNELFEEV